MNRSFLDHVPLSSNGIHEGLICVYCKRILVNPLQSKCGHRFCEECQGNDAQVKGTFCPKCNEEIDELQYDYAALRDISNLKIKCPMEECTLKNGFGKVSDHLSHCVQVSGDSRFSCDSDFTIENGDLDIVSSLDDDINEEVMKMKRSIDVLTLRSEEVNTLTKRFDSLRSMVNVSNEQNEKNMSDFILSVHENYKKIETLINKSKSCRNSMEIEKSENDVQNELSALKEKYISLEESITTQRTWNQNMKQNISHLYSKIKSLDEEKKQTFNQFYEEVEYLANEFSIIKTSNETKVIKFYNKIDRYKDKLAKLATQLPELFQEINKLKKVVKKVKNNRTEYNFEDLSNIGKEISRIDDEVRMLKETINHLINHNPSSVFVTVFFQERIGMNMSLKEVEIFIHQFETTLEAIKEDLELETKSNRSSLLRSTRILRRRSAFTLSDRKKKSQSQNNEEQLIMEE